MTDPMHPVFNLADRIARLIPEVIEQACGRPCFYPRVDIAEDKDAYTVWAELPGFSQKDVQVSYENGVLTLKGEKKVEKSIEGATWHSSQREVGTFEHHVRVGGAVDGEKIAAAMRDGVLRVTLPKRPDAKGRTIDVQGE